MMRGSCQLLAVLCSAVVPGLTHALPAEVTIGVISPRTGGRSAGAGQAHEDTIKYALAGLGSQIVVDGRAVRLVPLYEDDRASPEESRAAADRLVRQGAVAILGPVNSSCTRAVVERDGEKVPIISGLSTAPGLTQRRDPWFFRATVDDGTRMQRLARHLDQERDMAGASTVILYEDDSYGQGLKDSLRANLEPGDAGLLEAPWPVADGGWSNGLPQLVGRIVETLPPGPARVFVLGTSERAGALAAALDRAFGARGRDGSIRYYFAGNPELFVERAPFGSISIAEPIRDRDPRDVKAGAGDDAVPWSDTVYDAAYFVLPEALEKALRRAGDQTDPPALRNALREVLESETFDSLTPWVKVRFQNGSLQDPPTTPIYQMTKTFRRRDRPPAPRWVRLTVPGTVPWLETPVEIAVEGHGYPEGEAIDLQISKDPGAAIVERARLVLKGGQATHLFAAGTPGRFTVTANAPSSPHQPTFEVRWTFNYLLAALGGIAGSLLAIFSRRGAGQPIPLERILLGTVVGLALFAASTIGRVVPQLAAWPIPRFGGPGWLAALCSGGWGGWAGLGLLGILPSQAPEK